METPSTIDPDALQAAVEAFLSPISPSSPCGQDVSYDPDFLELKNEIDNLGEGAVVDFGRITAAASGILKGKSKDIRVAVYLIVGLARTRKAEGIVEGLAIVRHLVEAYWDDLHPIRANRRVPALTFLATNLSAWLERDENRKELNEPDILELAASEVRRLSDVLSERLGDSAPPFGRLERALRDAKPKEMPKPVRPATGSHVESKRDGRGEDGEAEIARVEDDTSATLALYQIASLFRKSDPTNPVSYKLVRAARWRTILKAPDDADGVTKLPPPAPQRIQVLQNLVTNADWAILIQETEKAMQESGFHVWLELQQIADKGLRAAGPAYENAADAVVSETLQLVKRVPRLVELSFNDGTPFASLEARDWIEALRGGGSTGASQHGTQDEATLETIQVADALAAAGKLQEALAGLLEASRSAQSGAERFRLDLHSARILRKSGKNHLAKGILSNLEERVLKYALDEWDPSLVVDLWTEMIAVYEKLSGKKGADAEEARRKVDEILSRLATLDINTALRLA